MMEKILEFAINNWWIIVIGIAILPTIIWALIPFVVALVKPSEVDDLIPYKRYWKYIVRLDDISYSSSNWGKIVHWVLGNWFVRLINLISFLWVWGYVLFIIGYAVGVALHWLIIKVIWRALKAIAKGITYIIRAI